MKVKISKIELIALLVAMGFPKASGWGDDKLKDRALQIPKKVDEADVPEKHTELYTKLSEADEVELVEEEQEEGGDDADLDGATKADLKAIIEEEKLPIKVRKQPIDELRNLIREARKAAAEEKPRVVAEKVEQKAEEKTPAKPAKAEKKASSKPATPAKKVDRDGFGCKVGTISATVNASITKQWQDEKEIAEAAGVTLDQARGRLYYAAEKGEIEYRRRIEYRLKSELDSGKK